jgi:hypothetical protein
LNRRHLDFQSESHVHNALPYSNFRRAAITCAPLVRILHRKLDGVRRRAHLSGEGEHRHRIPLCPVSRPGIDSHRQGQRGMPKNRLDRFRGGPVFQAQGSERNPQRVNIDASAPLGAIDACPLADGKWPGPKTAPAVLAPALAAGILPATVLQTCRAPEGSPATGPTSAALLPCVDADHKSQYLALRACHPAQSCMANPPSRTEYDNPPVIETVLSAEFAPLPNWQIPHFGLFWQHIRQDYPQCEVKPALSSAVEQFDTPHPKPEDLLPQLLDQPPIRCWFVGDTSLVQVQNDRLIYNWRKGQSTLPYPRYEPSVRPGFEKLWRQFIVVDPKNWTTG